MIDLFTGVEAQRFYLFVVVGLIGFFSHYLKKWLREEITGSLWKYLFRDKPKATGLAIFTFVGTAFAMFIGGQIPAETNTLLMLAFTTGYMVDSAMNSGVKS